MRTRSIFLLVLGVLAGCDVSIPNGLFACGQPSDCPGGYFCWSSDSRCYDSKEPACEPKTCEEVISEFGDLGISIECGSLPDGCDGSIECGQCPPGTECGANGQNFVCGCQENTCSTYQGGAECGSIPSRCDGSTEAIDCGACFGDYVCVDNRCVCPPGADCDPGCPDGEPLYPCAKNECSPPGGLPDGCGGVAHCPPCTNGEECVFSDALRYECIGDCTCEAQGVECGNATICGALTPCGTCQNNGFAPGYWCQGGRCVCEDPLEDNDSPETAALVCGSGASSSCLQDAWSVDLDATLHSSDDIDYYVFRVLHASTPIIAQVTDQGSFPVMQMAYLCPDGRDGMTDCSSSTDSVGDVKFCVTDGDTIGILRRCDDASSQVGTLLVGVGSKEFRGDCDPYGLKVFATYQIQVPVEF